MAKVLKWEITKSINTSNKMSGASSIPIEATFSIDFGDFTIIAKTDKVNVRDEDALIQQAKEIIKTVL